MANPAHQLITREEFDAKLEETPRWQKILENLRARAYDDLQLVPLDLSKDVLLTTVIGVRGQDAGSVKLYHMNFLVKEIQSVESGNG